MDWSNEVYYLTHVTVLLISDKGYRESETQVKEWLSKSMVEREEQVQAGIESGAFIEDGYILVDRLMNRICAPKTGELQFSSIILWTKESADDKVKTWDKVVCLISILQSRNLCYYSLEEWSMTWTNWTTNFQLRML